MKFRLSRVQWLCVGYVVLHFAAHLSARWFAVVPGISVSIWYPPCGLALSLLVLLGPRYWWVVFLANFAGAWLTPTPRVPWTAFFFPGLITANYTLAAWLVRKYLGPRLLPGGRRGTWIFSLAMIVPPLVVALIGTSVITIDASFPHPSTVAQFFRSVVDWAIGDASGLLTVVPVIMVFVAPWLRGAPSPLEPRNFSVEGAAIAAGRAIVLLGTLILVLTVPLLRDHSAFYICFLPLVWICVHHGLPGATLATLLIMIVGLVGMRLTNTSLDFSYIFLLFEIAVIGVGLGLGASVTRRNEAEIKLAGSQARLDRVIAGAQLGLWDWNVPERRFEANTLLTTKLGYTAEKVTALDESGATLIHPSDLPMVVKALTEHIEGRSSLYEAEYRLKAANGNWHWIHSRGSVVLRDREQRPTRISGTHVDISERRHAESEIRRLFNIIEATPDFVLTTDAQGRVLYANAALLAVWTHTESGSPWLGRHLGQLFPGEPGRRLNEEAIPAAKAHGMWQGEIALTSAPGRTIPVSQVVLAHRVEESEDFTFSFIMRDISDQKHAEAERIEHERNLLQLQKNESLSVLAGGIAHDFNNLLTAVVGNANLAKFDLPPGAPAHELLGNIEQAAARASALCHQMLAYAGRTSVAFAEVDLNRLIDDTFQLLEPGLNKKIEFQFERGHSLAPVLAASAQMQQVVMNLALNAADAIGEKGGRLTIRTTSRRCSAEELAEIFSGQPLPEGNYALLEVEDTGCGMTAEVRSRIFEPFFTTKFTGQGLGLAAVIGVVRSHRGGITVHSEAGKGTRFRLAFPALETHSAPEELKAAPEGKWRGSGKILVVDDDGLIRQVTRLLLTKLGFTPVIASDGVQGVAAFREHADDLRAVLLDLTMPGMDGFEAHAEMHRHNARVPVILMSGFSQKLSKLPPEAIHPAGVLAKPFGVEQLCERLQSVLD
ncbi:MAG TPA: ATP-binding protein [Lacunisphaera sp.]|jgi:PAS domain S-box-containing protein